MVDPKIINYLKEAIKANEQSVTPYDATAEVVRVEDGVAWVHIPGGVDETPAFMSVSAKPGDSVRVRVANGQAWISGNETAPPTDDTKANAAGAKADEAYVQAETANEIADEAHRAAESAQESATIAAGAAASAQASADNASEYAARALGNLSTVQSVAETLNWITQHGTMTLTTDTELNPAHVYFVVDANGDYTVGGTHYSVVTEPSASELANYYELDIDESLTNYVGTHLAVTGEGLWVLPASTGYKVLIATGNGTTYTEAGTYIIDPTGATVAKFGATTQIGVTTGTYVDVDSSSVSLKTHIANVLIETARFAGYALYLAGRKIRLLFESNVGTLTVYGNNGTGSRLNLKAVRLGSSGLEASEANINIDIDSSGTAKTSFDSDVYMSENLQVGSNLDVQNITALDISNDKTSSADIEFSDTITDSAGTPISVWPDIEDYLSEDLGTMASDISTLVSDVSACLKKNDGVITNFNDETATGFHTYTSSATNRPPVNAGGFAIVLRISSTSVWQLAFITSTSSTAMQAYARRMYSSGNWTSWRAFTFAS
jgi:hypothetical protein